jgi:predicted phosphate transport protein (TIGR00153 family)
MATTNPLMKLLGHSPFGPLQEHMRVVVHCADKVPALFDALCAGDEKKIHEIRDEIFALESQADEIKNELRSHLPKTLFMPVDRRDILEILDLQDAIADTAQDIAGALMVRRPKVLDSIHNPLMDLTGRCLEACHQMAKIMEQLDELVETGFRGPGPEIVLTMINDLNRIETDTDHKAINLLTEIFAHEDEIDPVSLMIWHRLIRWVGDLADYSEMVGNRLRLLIAH